MSQSDRRAPARPEPRAAVTPAPTDEPPDRARGAASPDDFARVLDAAGGGCIDLRGVRLIDADLSGLDLSGCDLSGADLSRADLTGTKLVRATLRDTVLYRATVTKTMLLNADLSGADLTECAGTSAVFGSATLVGAVLFGADLSGAVFTGACLADADLRTANLNQARLREADLSGADFSKADLRESDLRHSNVGGARFVDADLRSMRPRQMSGFSDADWIGADIADVDFAGAYLVRRTIMDQNYLHEFRSYSRPNAAIYWVWRATSDCGRSFLRWGLWILALSVVFGALFQLVAVDYGDHQTPLSSFYFSIVTLTTLGYGDVLPASAPAQMLVLVEVVLGYLMLGGLLSIFANKMARRAE